MTAPLHAIALSVVVPTMDHRGHIAESVPSWTRGQSFARERYEVLVVSSGREPEVDAAARPFLTAADRFLSLESANEPALHDHGARAARGKWILFTEAHCVAAPDCLAALVAYLEAHEAELAGACLRSTSDHNPHPIARLEDRAYQDAFATWSRPGDWRKVTIRGFAVRRDAYLAVGGFRDELGCFSEMAIAVDLHANGYRLGCAEAATVKHYNSTDLGELLGYIREYREREVDYRAQCPADRFEAYLASSAPWEDTTPRQRRMALGCAAASFVRAIARCWHPQSAAMARAMLATLILSACDVVAGRRAGLLRAHMAYVRARTRFALAWRDADNRYRCYQALWDAAGWVTHERACLRAGTAAGAPTPTGTALEYRPGAMTSQALIGFHAREIWEGQPFRWSGPLAQIRVAVEPADYEVWLETNGLVACAPGSVDLYVNGRRARPVAAPGEGTARGRLAFRADRAMFAGGTSQDVAIATGRLRAADKMERRALGLPVFEIAFVPDQARP